MKYDYNVTYVTGKSNVIPDTLSRALTCSNTTADYELINAVQVAAEVEMADIPITDQKLAIIKAAQHEDSVCKMVRHYCDGENQWPEVRNLLPVLKPYYHVRKKYR